MHCEVGVRLCFRVKQPNPIRIIGELICPKCNFGILTRRFKFLPVCIHWLCSILHINLLRVDYNFQVRTKKPLIARFLAFANDAIFSCLNILLVVDLKISVVTLFAFALIIERIFYVVLQSSYFS